MVFGNEISYPAGQSVATRQFKAIRYVADYYACAAIGVQIVVRIAPVLILAEELRAIHFADVVIKSTDTYERAICLDLFSALFGQVRDHDAMMIGTRRFPQ